VTGRRRITLWLVLAGIGLVAGLLPSISGAGTPAFPQGVAARSNAKSAIIWSRAAAGGVYEYRVALDKKLEDVVKSGSVEASEDRDLTLKATVKGLKPGKRYFYRFYSPDGKASDVGTFETLPSLKNAAAMKLAFTGDSDILWTEFPDGQSGSFEVLDRIRQEKPDLFVYMGDTIYSDSETGSPPALTRAEKWAKYRDNRIDPTQKLLASTSTWAMWDDHEFINDFSGVQLAAQDPALLQAGVEAFSDYWPVPDYWPLGNAPTYGRVDFGKNIDLFFLDERLYRSESAAGPESPCRSDTGALDLAPKMPADDRTALGLPPVNPACLEHIDDPSRTMLGAEQKQWLKDQLAKSKAKWKLIMNEVPIVQLFVLPYDRWDGYSAERTELLEYIGDNDIPGVVFLTTDIHANIGSPAFVDILAEDPQPVAWEIVTGPIQTCTLDCEVDGILGSSLAGEVLKSFLIDHGLIYVGENGVPPCADIDTFAYSVISTNANAKTLNVKWKSNEGSVLEGCASLKLKP
jgi:alkaline phosphatase D